MSDCNVFVRHMFPHTTQIVPCPLRDSTLCSAPGSDALAVESSNISFSDLGVNWPYAKDIYIRRRSVYTPILAESFHYGEEEIRDYFKNVSVGNSTVSEAEYKHVRVFSFIVDEYGRNLSLAYSTRDRGNEYYVSAFMALNGSFAIKALEPQELAPEFTVVTVRGPGLSFPAPSDDPVFYAQVNDTVVFENRV
ncbi:hypothetical protein E8E12_003442 [Didymella heteroderae]|uniref:Uncharacterized protein n=1 Tax=Didymella heteroderae TaxID=1769908 RepID=A0A9P4WH92_9PLEO|nr:hypothetical protein E8E12_003442 [Didymella heteroderae]